MKRNFVRQKGGLFQSFVHVSKIAVLLKSAPNFLRSHLMQSGVIVLLVSHFVLSNSLCSPFKVISHFGVDNHSLPINASPVANSDTGQIQHFVQTSATGTAIEPCQAPPLLPTNSDQVLGKDGYSSLIVDLCSFSGVQEKGLLECSYADYLEGCDSVIVKGRLTVNVSFWETIGASQFIISVIREGHKIFTEFVGSLLCSERFFSGNSGFPLSSKTNI